MLLSLVAKHFGLIRRLPLIGGVIAFIACNLGVLIGPNTRVELPSAGKVLPE